MVFYHIIKEIEKKNSVFSTDTQEQSAPKINFVSFANG